MDSRLTSLRDQIDLLKVIGYLNFSNGKPDARFQKAWNQAQAFVAGIDPVQPWLTLCQWLLEQCDIVATQGGSAFQDVTQAKTVLSLLPGHVIPAYKAFHKDILGHLSDSELLQPFFVARMIECLLASGGNWEQRDKIIPAVIDKLNDFLGYRPIATLENKRLGEPYAHERFRPIPVYLRDAGVGNGRHQKLIQEAISILQAIPADLLDEASFDLARLEEWAYDPRCYDHSHPANRRPNYVFGEWDPQYLDLSGEYRRYVSREITLQILLQRLETDNASLRQEYVKEAGIVLAGTVLMASAMSGRGPGSYDSTVKLSTLVPRIAKLRDNYYTYCFGMMTGPHKKRLEEESERLRQPFGGARQWLNQAITKHRAAQLQARHIAYFLTELSAQDAALDRLASTTPISDKFQVGISGLLSEIDIAIETNDLAKAAQFLVTLDEILHRGIECGALADPWNALGFHGQFPIFQSMEDAILDHRLIELCEIMESSFGLAGRVICEAAAAGQQEIAKQARKSAERLALWWDQYATFEVSDLPRVAGEESIHATLEVAEALAHWHQQGETTGDLAFWRQHLHRFKSASSFSIVVDVLLHRGDYAAVMALLINWLSHASEVPLEDGRQSYFDLMLHWTLEVLQSPKLKSSERWKLLKRFLDLLEANAEEYWDLSSIELKTDAPTSKDDNPYAAAYEGMEYRDSTDDGVEGSLADDEPTAQLGVDFPLESQSEAITQRIRFLAHVAHLWRLLARQAEQFEGQKNLHESLTSWWQTSVQQRERLMPLLQQIQNCVVPEPLGNQASMMEYDRQRNLKERVLEAGVSAALDVAMAERSLLSASYAMQKADVPSTDADDWERHAVQLENLTWRGKVNKISPRLEVFLKALRHVSLLYRPLDAGGQLEDIYKTRSAQTILRDLVTTLPRLGLVQDTYKVLMVVRDLERSQSVQGRVVTEFNRLFEFAMSGLTISVARSSTYWSPTPSPGKLVQLLDQLAKPFLVLWIDHSHSVRLSSLEAVHADEDWTELREFIRKFGSDLFHPKFMTLANLRAILSRGVNTYLDYLKEEAGLTHDDDPSAGTKLLNALQRNRISRDTAVRLLELVLKAIVENYEEYKDYNATTTQSDYGENLFRLVSFLRLKSTYERHLWNIKPLIWIHDSLAREGHDAAALLWKQSIVRMTADIARRHVEHLRELQAEHGMQLRTVADLVEEKLVAPLDVDRLTALVAPAVNELKETRLDKENESGRDLEVKFGALQSLLAAIDIQAKTTSGSGLDVPAWIRKLEQEGDFVFDQQSFEKALEVPFHAVSEADLEAQLTNWDVGHSETGLLPG
ncbi:MAG TPA: hypothetical protein PLN21_03050 [Gemmatales bacterium]|nr:hypothetical protein [Gemmatales bacterium]